MGEERFRRFAELRAQWSSCSDAKPADLWERDGFVRFDDGSAYAIRNLKEPKTARCAIGYSLSQKELDRLCGLIDVEALSLHAISAKNVEALSRQKNLKFLSFHWASKIEDLTPLTELPALKVLDLTELSKLRDLSFLKDLKILEALQISGSTDTPMRLDHLVPIAQMPRLAELVLLASRVKEGGLHPLGDCEALSELGLADIFSTEDVAYLTARLPKVFCERFQPYYSIRDYFGDGKTVKITGQRKPRLHPVIDAARIENYVRKWEQLVSEFSEKT
ncbi:Internalin-A precursor [Pelagimonas phthalicica]|uniref:Internalin-A n=1 Tax=Pelagimonas phthalicica TaxID=1037362 RepID=A0A238J7S5_9RHOB|nr:leucine-rich repeat domain-containing protein [Pelagimonas phthalicica]TDS95202.1 hypothetical protein CLV87_1725 [Pelagimonas phthalicica]SMX26274.1 Internalin-A precursor [Pelagimonas phthalicica]